MITSTTVRHLRVFRRYNSTLNKGIFAVEIKEPGHIYDTKPFSYECKAGKAYMWCTCGWSKNQPFCDGTHRNEKLKISHKPLRFDCTETKNYWFCNCKQTKTKPFCDGSHKLLEKKTTVEAPS